MGLVTFTLDDLCAFFTSKLPDRLVVGLLDNEATAASAADVHTPIIIIQDADSLEILKTYSGFGQLGGDIHLQVQPAQALTVLEQPDGLRHPFSRLVDLERVLYQQNFHIQPNRCRTRLHFSNGRLYTVGQLFNVRIN